MKNIILVLGAMLVLAGCESMGHLSPANPQAEEVNGEIPLHFTTVSSGNGKISGIGHGGEVLTGEYGPIPGDYAFGSVFNAVYGEFSTLPTAADKGTPTVATITGNKGTTLKCEFYNDNYRNSGFGACKSLTGALYRLQY